MLPEFLPAGDPRRREWEEGLIESAQFANPVVAARLRGVTVVLDAGHGGQDVGASVKGTWESLYVYDIMVRTKRLLEGSTAARVIATTSDGDGFEIQDRDRLPYSRSHRVLTQPAYPIDDSSVGVHLRWYLSNSVYRKARSEGVGADKVVFLSIHADSLHPSLRGAMVYIPSAQLRGGEYGKSGAVYAARSEYRERPRVSFSRRELLKSEGQSNELAQQLVSAFHAADLAVHADKPVRRQIVRRRPPVGAGGAALQRGAHGGAARGLQSGQPGGPPAHPDLGVPPAGGRGDRRRRARLLRFRQRAGRADRRGGRLRRVRTPPLARSCGRSPRWGVRLGAERDARHGNFRESKGVSVSGTGSRLPAFAGARENVNCLG